MASLSIPEKTHPYGWPLASGRRVENLPAYRGDKSMGEGEGELMSLEHLLAKAVAKRNAVALELLLAPEFSVQTGGKNISRSEWLEMVASLKTRSLTVENVTVDHFGEVAVMTARLRWQAQSGDAKKPKMILDGAYRVTDVWTRRNDRWQLCSRASQKIVPSRRTMSAA